MGKRATRFMQNTTLFLSFLAVFVPGWARAQLSVTGVTPRQNEINAGLTTTIEATFSGDLDPATLTPETWQVRGSLTGIYAGSLSYVAATRTARFVPATVFKEGEVITVTLTGGLRGNDGSPLSPAFQWSFTVAVEFGTGIFNESIEIPMSETERDPEAICTGDFNNDAFPDFAVVNSATNSVSIYLNQFGSPGGSFLLQGSVTVGNGPNSVSGADFDRDGLMDLAVSNFDENSISVLKNTGGGSFVLSQTVATAHHPVQVEPADLDNDGDMDLAVIILGINQLQIFLNQGNSTFLLTPEIYNTRATPLGLASGDLDNDGDIDLAVSNSGDNTILVFRNDGQARFANSGEIPVPDFPTVVRIADVVGRDPGEHGDGFLDLVLLHPDLGQVSVLENRSRDGSFVMVDSQPVGVLPSGFVVADVDTADAGSANAGLSQDHDLDLAVANLLSHDLYILRNQVNGGFSQEANDIFSAGETPSSITAADFDKDGDIDVAVTNLTTQTVTVLLNRGGAGGSIRFTEPPQLLDFGQVYVGVDSTQRLSLFNPTNEVITLAEISTALSVFTVSDSQATLNPGQTFELAVTFSPTDTVVYEDSLTIRSSLAGAFEVLKLGLRGEGIQASISVVPDTLNFGGLLPPQTGRLPIEISNRGNGALLVSDMRFTDPVFSTPQSRLTVPPHSSLMVDIDFVPTATIAYLDTLTILSNDSLNPQVSVILLGGPNRFPPRITSPDTVVATEDIFFQYTATASDSDGTQPRFSFRNLPHWLAPSSSDPGNASVEGTPREGDLDTSFVVIADDGLFADTAAVYVRVIPVNDPPQFDPLSGQAVPELTLLRFDLRATDPEDSTLAFRAENLPLGATLQDNGNKTATFSWTPPFGSRGTYDVRFIVTEVFEPQPLSDTLLVRISVLEAQPDLVVASLGISSTDITLNQTRVITGVVRSDLAPAAGPFRLTFLHDGAVAKDTVISNLDVDEERAFTYSPRFDRLGSHQIVFQVDSDNQVAEVNEDNNEAVLLLKVTKGRVVVRPNPFTPNADGFNDEAVFDFGQLVLTQPELKIFDFNGVLLRTLNRARNLVFRWDGRDSRGHEQKPGVYLYILFDNNKRVGSGYIALAR